MRTTHRGELESTPRADKVSNRLMSLGRIVENPSGDMDAKGIMHALSSSGAVEPKFRNTDSTIRRHADSAKHARRTSSLHVVLREVF